MMKLLITFLLSIFLFSNSASLSVNGTYQARNYIVMDAYTNEVLEDKDIDQS